MFLAEFISRDVKKVLLQSALCHCRHGCSPKTIDLVIIDLDKYVLHWFSLMNSKFGINAHFLIDGLDTSANPKSKYFFSIKHEGPDEDFIFPQPKLPPYLNRANIRVISWSLPASQSIPVEDSGTGQMLWSGSHRPWADPHGIPMIQSANFRLSPLPPPSRKFWT